MIIQFVFMMNMMKIIKIVFMMMMPMIIKIVLMINTKVGQCLFYLGLSTIITMMIIKIRITMKMMIMRIMMAMMLMMLMIMMIVIIIILILIKADVVGWLAEGKQWGQLKTDRVTSALPKRCPKCR